MGVLNRNFTVENPYEIFLALVLSFELVFGSFIILLHSFIKQLSAHLVFGLKAPKIPLAFSLS